MLTIKVAKDGTGDFTTITEAVQSIPYGLPARVEIGAGVYEEKLFCEKKHISLVGSGVDRTFLRWGDGAYDLHADGRKLGTFRSYTAFFSGETVCVSHMTVENTAGDGETHGQAIAVYADAQLVYIEDVRLLGHQDTLFCAPLPARERLPDGFLGPRRLAPRVPTAQLYRRCTLRGDVDFIFGGADAVFEECELVSNNRGQTVNGYVAAPSGEADGLGFVFEDCRFTSDCAAGTVWLGRPWRANGKAVLLNCELGAHIAPAGWDTWDCAENEHTAYFAEYQSRGRGANPAARAKWARALSDAEATEWRAKAKNLKQTILNAANAEDNEGEAHPTRL